MDEVTSPWPIARITLKKLIYKIVPAAEWETAVKLGRFEGSAVDVADGFIHFSTAGQVKETARRHFEGMHGLLLVAVNSEALDDLRWEPSRGGDLFPHLYGPLNVDSTTEVFELPIGKDGLHLFPESFS